MKIGSDKLKMSSGEVRSFSSSGARNRYEKVAKAIKNGWRPKGGKAYKNQVLGK